MAANTHSKVIVFGATGRTGIAVIEAALKKDYEVSAFVHRSPLPDHLTDKVNIIKGDVMNSDDVKLAVCGHDKVLAILGTGNDLSPTTVISEGTKNIVAAMKEHGLKRIAVCNSAFVLRDRLPLLFRMVGFGPLTEDHRRQIAVLRETDLEWIAVCPPGITNTSFTGEYEIFENESPRWYCSKHHIADLMVKSLCDDTYVQKLISCGDRQYSCVLL